MLVRKWMKQTCKQTNQLLHNDLAIRRSIPIHASVKTNSDYTHPQAIWVETVKYVLIDKDFLLRYTSSRCRCVGDILPFQFSHSDVFRELKRFFGTFAGMACMVTDKKPNWQHADRQQSSRLSFVNEDLDFSNIHSWSNVRLLKDKQTKRNEEKTTSLNLCIWIWQLDIQIHFGFVRHFQWRYKLNDAKIKIQ